MTIFDLPLLSENDAFRLAHETVSQHPVLTDIYDDEALQEIIIFVAVVPMITGYCYGSCNPLIPDVETSRA